MQQAKKRLAEKTFLTPLGVPRNIISRRNYYVNLSIELLLQPRKKILMNLLYLLHNAEIQQSYQPLYVEAEEVVACGKCLR